MSEMKITMRISDVEDVDGIILKNGRKNYRKKSLEIKIKLHTININSYSFYNYELYLIKKIALRIFGSFYLKSGKK